MRALALGLAVSLALAGAASAQSDDRSDREFRLSGDWGGLRTRLKDQGWTFQAREKFEAATNISGGERKLGIGAGELRLGATADLEKLFGISGGEVQLTFTDRHGGSLSPQAGIDALQPVIEVHGRGDRWRLTELWYSQDLLDGRLNLKAGRTNPGSDFDGLPCDFQNLTFCGAQPGNLAGDYWYNWPVSQWGGRLKLSLGDGAAYVQGGAYQVNPENLTDEIRLSPSGGKGTLYPVEAGWTPKLGEAGRPGTYLVGAWIATADGEDVLLDENGVPRSLSGAPALVRDTRYGAYVSLRQQVSGEPDGPGVTLFLNAIQTDRGATRLDRQAALGAEWRGAFAGRPDDVLALAFGATHVNDRAARSDALAGKPAADTEYVGELDYRIHGPKGLTLTPNLQYVRHPGGLDRDSAVVAGVKLIVGL